MAFSYKTAGLTKTWKITIFCFVILLIYVVTWILVGDYNALHQQWMIAKEGAVWSGMVSGSNRSWLWNTYQDQIRHWKPNADSNNFAVVGDGLTIKAYQLMFNSLVLLPQLLTLGLAIAIPLLMKIFKLMNIDVLPFSITLSLSAIAFMFSGLIPHTFNTTGIWIIRIVILLVCLLGFFLLFNSLINRIIASGAEAEQAIVDYSAQSKDKLDIKQSLTRLTEEYKKQDDVSYVEKEKP